MVKEVTTGEEEEGGGGLASVTLLYLWLGVGWEYLWILFQLSCRCFGAHTCHVNLHGVNFLCWLLFRYPFHPCVTAVARKRPRSFCQKHRWQVTAKHAYTLHIWLCMKWHAAWLYGVHRTCWDGSSFLWHQPCQRCKYTTSVDIQKTRCKKLLTHVESHASAVSLLESGE